MKSSQETGAFSESAICRSIELFQLNMHALHLTGSFSSKENAENWLVLCILTFANISVKKLKKAQIE